MLQYIIPPRRPKENTLIFFFISQLQSQATPFKYVSVIIQLVKYGFKFCPSHLLFEIHISRDL